MKSCLIVFAKEPQEGRVKTRLRSCLSMTQRLNLYKAFLKDTIDLTKNIKCDLKILAYTSRKRPDYLKRIGRSFRFYRQKGSNLGQKMYNAFKSVEVYGDYKSVIIGSDSPSLPAIFIKNAFEKLDKNDLVLGPTLDGGYYLIGLKKPCIEIFEGIKWSSSQVLKDTVRNAKKLGKKISILKSWYDIDKPKDVVYLKKDLKNKNKDTARWTRRFLKI